jgi:small-conductance mechanosensitive channel
MNNNALLPDNIQPFVETILFDPLTGQLISLGVAFAVIVAISKALKRTLSNKIEDTGTRYRIRKLIEFAGFVAFVIALSLVFSDKLGGLTVAFGVAGAGVAFALQEVIASVAGWAVISLNRIFKPGDRILLNGICGDVIDVGVLRTTLMECGGWVSGDLYNGRIVRVSNSAVFKEAVYNYNTDFPFLWDEITIPIHHSSNLADAQLIIEHVADEVVGQYSKNAEKAWERVVKRYMIENARVVPLVTLTADENWVTFTLRYVTAYNQRRGIKSQLFKAVLQAIQASNGAVKLACAELDITALPSLEVYGKEPTSI